MIHLTLIRDLKSGKLVAVIGHDSLTRQVVYRVRPADALLQKALDTLSDRDVAVQEEGVGFVKRRRILRSDEDFLMHFLDKAIQHPYEPCSIDTAEQGILDTLVDEKYSSDVDFKEAV